MCGIFWYKWKTHNIKDVLLTWLKRLEYRGYDSAGMAFLKKWEVKVVKALGKVANLEEKLRNITIDNSFEAGMAHTRWATHGGVTLENTHPHWDSGQSIFLVHNWIIENFKELKQELTKKGYSFYSQTDTEVIAKLLEDNKKDTLLKTVESVLPLLEGAYALLIFSKDFPDEMVAVRFGSPLVIGFNDQKEIFFSSDTQALAGFADKVIFLDDGDVVGVKGNDFVIKSNGKLISKAIEKIDVESLKAEKWDFPHYMLKEIFEQPEVLKNVFRGRVDFKSKTLHADAFRELDKLDIQRIVFIASWTSYHAWIVAARWFEDLVGLDTGVEIGSEFVYKNFKVKPTDLYVFISQSGETADSIEALKLVQAKGGKTFGIVNVVWSTIARVTDMGMFTRAGTEVGVASTKAFVAQLGTLLLVALYLAYKNGIAKPEFDKIIEDLAAIPTKIEEILYRENANIKDIAYQLVDYYNFFFLGRHYQLPIAMEGSLKFKEITYLHSEAYPAWELKHGPLALIDEKNPSILIAPNDLMLEHNISTLEEVRARKGKVVVITDSQAIKGDWNIKIPSTNRFLYPFLTVVVSQLLAYHAAQKLWREIDKPRNLAKSVTVK